MRGLRSGCLLLAVGVCLQDLVPSVDYVKYIDISYNENTMQPLIDIKVGGQWLKLVYDASSGNTAIFVKETKACVPTSERCYSYNVSLRAGSVSICKENEQNDCDISPGATYLCDPMPKVDNVSKVTARSDTLLINGLQYDQMGIEAMDNVSMQMNGREVLLNLMPVRLYVEKMVTPNVATELLPIRLFENTDGIFGASGLSLSCRDKSVWDQFMQRQGLSSGLLIFDFFAPPRAAQAEKDGNRQSRIVFNEIDPSFNGRLIWSQPKQTGDLFNDGMHEFLVYHPKVCGIDLLYNTSSNWLAVIDTSGPCLTLPVFFFDRLRSRIALDCPFADGEPSFGRLCSPKRGADGSNKLPNLYFELEDTQEPKPPQLVLPLDRLVFNNGTKEVPGHDLLCVARADSEASRDTSADMMFAHIAIGSLAVAAFYTVVNLDNNTVGLAPRGDISEGSDSFCIESVTCMSPMQTYYPPRNVCEDPPCSKYMLMKLDESTKMCVWSGAVPLSFGLLLLALVVLDLVSHKLYKQAIDKASEFRS